MQLSLERNRSQVQIHLVILTPEAHEAAASRNVAPIISCKFIRPPGLCLDFTYTPKVPLHAGSERMQGRQH